MKRPLAYITAPWSNNQYENAENAATYCRQVYDAGYSPICPVLFLSTFLKDEIPQEHKDGLDMARDYLRRSHVLVVCGHGIDETVKNDIAICGRDEDGIPRYAHSKGTAGNFRLDVKGSDKAFNFCYRGEGDRLFAFEAPVDLLSFLCLFKKEWQKQSYLSLGGVGEKALLRFLSDRPNIKTVYLCLDSDQAGNDACSRLAELVPEGLTVHRLVPLFKDWNEVLQHRAEITGEVYPGSSLRPERAAAGRNRRDYPHERG